MLEVSNQAVAPQDFDVADPDRRIRLDRAPQPPLASLRWPGRPELANGNPCWTYAVRHPLGDFAVFIGHIENGPSYPFEVWVNGSEQPRGLGAIAKTLSMDMRAQDRRWLTSSSALQKAGGDDAFDMAMPPSGEKVRVPSLGSPSSSFATAATSWVRLPTRQRQDPVVDALIGLKEPKAGPDGTLSGRWMSSTITPAMTACCF